MPKFGIYKKEEPLSYTLGVFPSMELMSTHPEKVRALLLHPDAQRNDGARKLAALCGGKGIYVETAPKALQRLSGKENCFAALAFEKYEEELDAGKDHIVLVSCQDWGNMGTILRTALGFSFTDIALVRPCCDVFDPHVVRSSMGALFHHRVEYFDSFGQYEEKYPGRALYMFRLQNAEPLQGLRIAERGPRSLVFGNEASGLPKELENTGHGVRIDHSSEIDSLNLSVAASIGMYAFRAGRDAGITE